MTEAKPISTRVRFFLFIPILLLMGLSIYSFLRIENLINSGKIVTHTNVVKLQLERVLSYLKDAETSQRGFLLTRDSIFLQPYTKAKSDIDHEISRLDSLVSDNPEQKHDLANFRSLVGVRMSFMQLVLDHIKEGSPLETEQLFRGKLLMDSARVLVAKMIASEEKLLKVRSGKLSRETFLTPLINVVLTICFLLILILSYLIIVKEVNKSYNLSVNLAQTNKELEENKAEQIKLKAAQRFQLIADNMPQQIWTADASGKLDYFSRSVYELSGKSVEQLAIDGWLDIVHPDDREENVKRWLHSVETGEPFFFEHRFRRFDGEYRWELSRALPQYDENGNIQMWVGTSTDIQDQKMFAAELEKQVNLRTKILRETAEDLKKTNDELSQFNYVASHDLQEPLRKIQTFITRIHEMESQLSDKGRTYFEKINESAMRMQKLTNDLLAYSRANATEKHFEQVDLNKIVSTVIEQFSHTIDALKAEIIADDLPSLKAIPFQFEQLFSNLLGNSLKFYRKDVPLKIKIGYSKINSTDIPKKLLVNPGQYHHITVADNGIGFEQEYSERIFQVFQRLHGKHDFEGTGIGLAIVKKIVDNHNGYVMAAGENGLGATFHIYLPV